MPLLTRWFLKSALLYFVSALLVGVLRAAGSILPLPAAVAALGPVHIHLLMVGWVTQLIFGIAYWMFPKFSPQRPRGSEHLGWAAFWLLNAGLPLRVLAEPWMTAQPGGIPGGLLAISAVLQWLAGLAFVANSWGRVKER